MINLDQVRTLEWKVKQAVQLIVHLRRENDTLRGRLSDTEVRLQELETLLESFKATQTEMESGIRSALEELDHLDSTPEAPTVGPVDSFAYPPSEPDQGVEVVEAASVAETAPVAPMEKVNSEPEVSVAEGSDPSFEEEYAALEQEEAQGVAEALVPESIELEPEPVSPPEEKEPEQPGLGIF